MGLDFMTNLDYNVQADNLKCKQPEQNVEKSRSLVERARLEIVYAPQGYRGFESLLLRQRITVILIQQNDGYFMLKFTISRTFRERHPPIGCLILFQIVKRQAIIKLQP